MTSEAGPSGLRKPTVSIVMPFFNVEAFIAPAIESVLAQSYADWELLAIDDGSTDRSTEIARDYARRFPDTIRYFEHDGHLNRGASAARNVGGRHALGEYIAYLDADDIWLPHKLEQQVGLFAAHPQAGLVVGATKYWRSWTGRERDEDGDHVVQVGVPQDMIYMPTELVTRLYPLGPGTSPSMNTVMLRAELLEKAGGWEESFKKAYTDQVFLVKLYLNTTVFVTSDVWDLYRLRPDSSSNVALKGGGYNKIRMQFLRWFREYLDQNGWASGEISDLLDQRIADLLKTMEKKSKAHCPG